jgi:DNA-binding transcriptional ArsR family regulator
MKNFPPEALEAVAAYFQTLAEPTRLQILNFLRQGERNVGELAQLCGCTAANVSRHLALLTKQGIVEREGRGTSVYYLIADASIYTLCDLVCDNIARQLERDVERQQAFARPAPTQLGN